MEESVEPMLGLLPACWTHSENAYADPYARNYERCRNFKPVVDSVNGGTSVLAFEKPPPNDLEDAYSSAGNVGTRNI